MNDLLNLVLFAIVSLGALTLGVGLAFALLRIAFACMAPRQKEVAAKQATQAAKASA